MREKLVNKKSYMSLIGTLSTAFFFFFLRCLLYCGLLDFGQTSLEAGLEMGNSYCEAGPVRKLPWRPGRVRILCLETQELGPGTTSDHPLRNFDGSSSDGWGVNAPSATKTEMLLPRPPPPGQFA